MKHPRSEFLGVLSLAGFACSILLAQSLKLSPVEKKNQEIAIKEFKDMLQYGHVELANEFIAPGYIQHNPNVPPGRDGFIQFMSRNRKPEPVKPEWKNPPTLIIPGGPYVLFMTDRKAKDPADPDKEYTWDHFDMVRVENGQIQEHWDEARKNPPQR
jgi:predicted SnoaL-like aldol condensation-catalyzing enzyme